MLQVASGDLLKVYNDIHALLRDQHRKYAAETSRQLCSVSHHVNIPFFAPLIGKVTSYALNKLADELSRSRQPDFPRVCTGTFTRTMGLPCGHDIRWLQDANVSLSPTLIHRHWFHEPLAEPCDFATLQGQLLLNPLVSSLSYIL